MNTPDLSAGNCWESPTPDDWFPIGEPTEEDTSLCAGCPVAAECLDWALEVEARKADTLRAGIWGGTTPAERARLAKKRRRAPIAHGTYGGYCAEKRRGDAVCPACQAACDKRNEELSARFAKPKPLASPSRGPIQGRRTL